MSSSKYQHAIPNLPNKCTWKLGTSETDPHPHCPYKLVKPKILPNVLHAIGDTPLIKLNTIPIEYNLKCDLLAKCEFFNPGGSIKDRIAVRMIEDAEREKELIPGYTIIEPTSGNTGIGLALACVIKNYKCIITIPDRMSIEKVETLKALGAEVVRTSSNSHFSSSESQHGVAETLCKEIPNSIILNQYRNIGNPLEHYDITAEEILSQCDGNLDMIVIGAGTCGTLTGIGRKIKEKCPSCKVIGVDPHGSVVAEPDSLNTSDQPACKDLEGIGHEYIPTNLDRSIVDEWIKVTDKESFQMARLMIKKEGLLCGGSSGSAVYAAVKAAKELKEGQRCVIILPDGVRNYMTKFLLNSWMVEKEYVDDKDKLSNKIWWWNHKVKDLTLTKVTTTPLDTFCHMTCQNALDIMNDHVIDLIFVTDKNGECRHIVSIKHIMDQITTGKITANSIIHGEELSTFDKITLDSTLGCLSKILSKNSYAIVVKNKKCLDNGKTVTQQIATAIVTQRNLTNFIMTEKSMNEISTLNGFISE